MDVRIGLRHVARELTLEVDDTPEGMEARVTAALAGGAPLTLTDTKGRRLVVPAEAIGYVEAGGGENRRIGFTPLD